MDKNDENAVEDARKKTVKADPKVDQVVVKAVQNGLHDAIKRKTPPPGEA